jgi:hypothetical protein
MIEIHTVETGNSTSEIAAQLLHATLQMAYSSATEKLLNHTKHWKVGSYESGRLNHPMFPFLELTDARLESEYF